MIILVTGGRDLEDYAYERLLADELNKYNIDIIIQGGCSGADAMAIKYARSNGVHYATIPALWDYYDNPAGPRRNSAMVKLNIDLCIALPGNSGTSDMVGKCRAKGIPVVEIEVV